MLDSEMRFLFNTAIYLTITEKKNDANDRSLPKPSIAITHDVHILHIRVQPVQIRSRAKLIGP